MVRKSLPIPRDTVAPRIARKKSRKSASATQNLHIVLSVAEKRKFAKRCKELNLTLSTAGRVLVSGFNNGDIKIKGMADLLET